MRITESRLRRIIREELESDRYAIAVLGDTSTGPLYVVAYDKKKLEKRLDDPWESYETRNTWNYSGVIAGLTLKRDDVFGECNGAWRVSSAVSISNKEGWGTKVYLAAFEWLRNISSGRMSVSASAERLWKSLMRRGFVEPEPFDNREKPRTPPKSDDCKVFPSRDPVLNSSFRIKGTIPPDVSQLLDSGKAHLDSLGGERRRAEELLKTGVGDLFDNIYDG